MKDFIFEAENSDSSKRSDTRKKTSFLRGVSHTAILSKPRKLPTAPKLDVEILEPRILLSADPIVSMTGLAQIVLDVDGGNLEIQQIADDGTSTTDVHLLADVTSIAINGTVGNDSLVLGDFVFPPILFEGGGGTDDVTDMGAGFANTWIIGNSAAPAPSPTSSLASGEVFLRNVESFEASSGDQVELAAGVTSLGSMAVDADKITSIAGPDLALTIAQITDAIQNGFDAFGDVLADMTDAAEFVQALPFIGGSTLVDQADVTLGQALDFYELIDATRAKILDALPGSDSSASAFEAVVNAVDFAAQSLGPAVLSPLIGQAGIGQFNVDVMVVLTDGTILTETFDVDVLGADIQTPPFSLDSAVDQIVDGIAGQLADEALSEMADRIFVTAAEGRLAFQIKQDDVQSLSITAGAGDVVAANFGFGSTPEQILRDAIEQRLVGLGALNLSLADANFSLSGTNDVIFDFVLSAARQTGFSVDLGAQADAVGLELDAQARALLGVGAVLDASLMVGASGVAGEINGFGVGLAVELDLDTKAHIGILKGTITGELDANAGLEATGGLSFTISASGATMASSLGLDVTGADYDFYNDTIVLGGNAGLRGTLTLGADGGLLGAAEMTLAFSKADLFDGSAPEVVLGGSSADFLDFNDFSPEDLIEMMADFILWMEDATDSTLLSDIKLPFVSGGLDKIADLGGMLSDLILFDRGGDGVKDANDKLVTDLNDALGQAGLDQFIEFRGVVTALELHIVDDTVASVQFSNTLGDLVDLALISAGTPGSWTVSDLTGQLATALSAAVTVNFNTGRTQLSRDIDVSLEDLSDNVGLGDDAAGLLDRFNGANFNSVQGFFDILTDKGILPEGFSYDMDEDQLIFDLDLSRSLFATELETDFDLNLGELASVSSDSRIVLTGRGDLEIGFGIDLTTDFSVDPVTGDAGSVPSNTGDMDGVTLLSALKVQPKSEVAVTGTTVPPATATLSFSVENTTTSTSMVVTLPNQNLQATASDIATAINAQLVTGSTGITASLDGTGKLVFTAGAGVGIKINAGPTEPAIAVLGINDGQTGTQTVTAARAVARGIGVFATDAVITLNIDGETYDVVVKAASTLSVDGGSIKSLNRNIIDLASDVNAALSEARGSDWTMEGDDTVDLSEVIEADYQGNLLVLTLKSDAAGFDVVNAVPELGLVAGPANTDDLLIRLDNETFFTVDLTSAVNLGDVLGLIEAADSAGHLQAEVTPDDPLTAEDESGKSIRITYNNGSVLLKSIEATNGSSAASQLGIVGTDTAVAIAGSTPETPDGIITGSDIGGVQLADRLFLRSDDLSDVGSFTFAAEAGRLLNDLMVFGTGGDVLFSETLDLREYAGTSIRLTGVGNLTAGTYGIMGEPFVDIDIYGDGSKIVQGVRIDGSAGVAGQAGGQAVLETGVEAQASLGFIGVNLAGTANFSATASLGFNTSVGSPAADNILTLGEIIETFGNGESPLAILALPEITFAKGLGGDPDATSYGGADLTLSLQDGSAGFQAMADALLGGNASVDIGVEILAIGDPFLWDRFETFGGMTVTGADTFTVGQNLSDILAVGADLRFVNADGTIFDGTIAFLNSGPTTTVTLENLREVSAGAPETILSTATIENVVLLPSVSVDLPDVSAILGNGIGEFGLNEILDALILVADFLSQFESFGFLDEDIPVLDKSLRDVLAMADDLRDYINELREDPAGSLQFLEDALNDAIGLSSASLGEAYTLATGEVSGALNAFNIGFEETDGRELLTFSLNLGTAFSETMNVGFSELGFGDIFDDLGIGGVVDFSGSAGLRAEGGVFMTLAFGVDMEAVLDPANSVSDAVFLLDETALEATLSVGGENLAFNAALGPLALAIQSTDTEVARVEINAGAEVAWADASSEIVSLADLDLGTAFNIGGNQGVDGAYGTVEGVLPIFFPNDANYIGSILVGEAITTDSTGAAVGSQGNLANIASLRVATTDAELDGFVEGDHVVIDVRDLVSYLENFDFSRLSIFDNIRLAVDGFDGFLGLLGDNLFGALADLNLPLVGSSFADASDFIGDFRDNFIGDFRNAVDTIEDAAADFTDADLNVISNLLFDLLGPDGLDLLLALEGADLTEQTAGDYIYLDGEALRQVLFEGADISSADIFWDFTLGAQLLPDDLSNIDLGFDIGIPGLGLKSEAEMDLTIDWALNLGFGLSTKEGFYLDVENALDAEGNEVRELEFTATATPRGSITGELGFLGLSGETSAGRDIDSDGINETTELTAVVSIDVTDDVQSGDGDNRNHLALSEFGEIGLVLGLEVEAAAVLDLTLGIAPSLTGGNSSSGFPSIMADFDFLWGFENDFVLIGSAESDDLGSSLAEGMQYLAFNNVELDLGEYITEVLGPIVEKVAEVTSPLQPLIDVLTAPIPLIDVFGVNLTMLDIAATSGKVDPGMIKALAEVITLVNTVAELASSNMNLVIPIGDFVIFDNIDGTSEETNPFENGFSGNDVYQERKAGGTLTTNDVNAEIENKTTSGNADSKKGARTMKGLLQANGAFAFPILSDPSQIFGLLMGDEATLVTYDLAPLVADFEKSFFFSIFGPLGVSLNLGIEFVADFAFGYDTTGISAFIDGDYRNPLLLLDGLYVSDRENADGTGADVPELTFLGGITAAAELNLGVARAGVAGGLFIEILFDLFDPDNDGKVRINELVSNFVNQTRAPDTADQLLAPLAIFDVTGEIFARLFAFLKIDLVLFEIDKEWDLVDPITLATFEIDFFRPPIVASEAANGDLIINTGQFAAQRLLGDATDGDETVTVRKVPNSGATGDFYDVEVFTTPGGFGEDSPDTNNRFTYQVRKGQTIVVDGGNGNDTIILDGWNGNEVHFDIRGGAGNDSISFINNTTPSGVSAKFNLLDGGAGSDTIIGSSGNDLVIGGAGDDEVSGGGGDDLVLGDQASILENVVSSKATATDGRDTVSGGAGEDILIGGGNSDTLDGGTGHDLLLGDGGTVSFVSTGIKILSNVRALHNGGVTDVDGAGAADDITGGDGHDVIFAADGNDMVRGNADKDIIFGGSGFDTIEGGEGNNLIFGDSGRILSSLLTVSSDSFVANLSALTDASNVNVLLERLAIGPDGAGDVITAGSSKDIIIAGMGNDDVTAGAGDDLVLGEGGSDTLRGGAGMDDLRGGGQGDVLEGGDHNDILDGGTGADTVDGGGGDDLIMATKGSDDLNGGQGSDTYRINLSGGTTDSRITIVDAGDSGDVDLLEVNGTDNADRFLVRSDASGANAFIAGLNGDFYVERVNYGATLERLIVNGHGGDDIFAVDDTAAEMTLNGGAGADQFQVGQLFRTARNVNAENGGIDTGINADDFFLSIETTRGWLSNGISFQMTVNGGIGDDIFVVYHNLAVLQLNGESGDDLFEVRAFALIGSSEPQRERTDLTGGVGADTVRYAVNAPLNINGGDGYDTLVVIGTEFGDDFVITDEGVFGAGLNVSFVNIESLRVDGGEGDDRFFLQSTKSTVFTELFGGLGSDTFNVSGPTPPVVSNDLRGHSGIITHDMTSTDARYDGQKVFGVSANVADNDQAFAVITQTQGSTIIDEGDVLGDVYSVVLTRAPTRDVQVIVGAPLPSPDGRDQSKYAFRVQSTASGAVVKGDGSAVTLTFTAANWNVAQNVAVIADGIRSETPGSLFTRGDLDGQSNQPVMFNYDDAAFEGQTNGVVTHLFKSGVDIVVDRAQNRVSTADTMVVTTSALLGQTADDLLGRTVTISSGPGFGQSRFITSVSVGGTQTTLGFGSAWDADDAPSAFESGFVLRVSDAITGLIDTVTETKSDEVFDDRSTLTAQTASGALVDFGDDGSMIGRKIKIVGGTGAGQELLILGNTATELTLNGLWAVDPAADSVFSIGLYDGLQTRSVEVTINDNDEPGLIVDQNIALDGAGNVIADDDTLTAIIEGSDGDQEGERDVLRLRLNQALVAGETMTLTFDYDTSQIHLVEVGAAIGAAPLMSVDFTSGNATTGILVEVRAVDDTAREGAHSEQIKFGFQPDFVRTSSSSETLALDIPGSAPITSFGLTQVPTSITSFTIDNVVQVEGVDYEIVEASETELTSTILFIDAAGQPTERSGKISVSYTFDIPTFAEAFAQSVLVTISDDDAPTMLLRETGGSTDVIEGGPGDTYELVLTGQPSGDVTVDLTAIVTKSTLTGGIRHDLVQLQITGITQGGDTVVITEVPALDASGNQVFDSNGTLVTKVMATFTADNWDVPMVISVAAVDDAEVDGGDTKVFAPGPATLAGILGPVFLDGAGGSGSLDGLSEPLRLPGELNAKPPIGTALAINNTPGNAQITVSRADLIGLVLDNLRLRISADDNATAFPLASNEEIAAIVGKTVEIVSAPNAPSATDAFRLIIAATIDTKGTADLADDEVTFTLNEAYTDENGVVIETLTGQIGYALTSESLNFFVTESASVDVMFVNDDDSPADSSGVLTANRLFGLNMGPNTVIGERERAGGITFGNLEVIDITLGAGYNDFEIKGTPTREDGGGVWTIIRTGDEIADPNQPGVRIGDTVTADIHKTERVLAAGSSAILVNAKDAPDFRTTLTVDGNFDADAYLGQKVRIFNENGVQLAERWIISNDANSLILDNPLDEFEGGATWEIFDPADGNLSVDLQGGDDRFDAQSSSMDVVVFGGAGKDTILTGSGADIVFGDVGRVDYRGIPNANGVSAIVTRLGQTPDVIGGLAVGPFGAGILNTNQTLPLPDLASGLQGDPFATGDTGLIGLYVDINNGTGFLQEPRLIEGNTVNGMTISPNFSTGLDLTSGLRISTLPEDQTDMVNWGAGLILAIANAGGDDDVISTGAGDDVAIGGEANDDITAGVEDADVLSDDDIVFGDLGRITYDFGANPNLTPEISETVNTFVSRLHSIELATGGDDTLRGNAGSDMLIGGAGSDVVYGDADGAGAEGRDGSDLIFGDVGYAHLLHGVLQFAETYSTAGAADEIFGNAAGDLIFGGLGGDLIRGDAVVADLGTVDGDDVILGDHGRIDMTLDDLAAPTVSILSEVASAGDLVGGADTISADAGSDIVIGGFGGDMIDGDDLEGHAGTSDGGDILLGDNGQILFDTTTAQSRLSTMKSTDTSAATGGDDLIRGRAGADRIIGGIGADTIHGDAGSADIAAGDGLIDGADYILGDNGEMQWASEATPDYTTLDLVLSAQDGLGGADIISGNAGGDLILGGYGADELSGNSATNGDSELDGADVILGDNGEILLTNGTFAQIRTTDRTDIFSSNDTITGASGGDILLGGLGQDEIHGDHFTGLRSANDGNDSILGDNGQLIWDADDDLSDLDVMTSQPQEGIEETNRQGDDDFITGDRGADLIIAGYGDDTVHGNDAGNLDAEVDGDDVVLGDNGEIRMDGGLFTEIRTTDNTESFAATVGAADLITSSSGSDIVLGGLGDDTIHGDHADSLTSTHDAKDIVLGDNGEVIFNDNFAGTAIDAQGAAPSGVNLTTLDVIRTLNTQQGGNDLITTSLGDDLVLGGLGNDRILAGAQNDIVLGDFGRIEMLDNVVRHVSITDNTQGGNDTIFGDADEDVLIGGAGADVIDGDSHRDLIFGDNVSLDRIADALFDDVTDPRFVQLTGTQIYGNGIGTGAEGDVLVDHTPLAKTEDAAVWENFEIDLLDHTTAVEGDAQNRFGADYIAGGGDDDVIFAQLGDDMVQGDGSIDGLDRTGEGVFAMRDANGALTMRASFELSTGVKSAEDGDDYIEGNGGNDLIFGNLGQDDILGDNSDLYSLDTLDERTPTGSDILFGGAGTRIARNHYVEDLGAADVGTADITIEERHARDADMILGDNGRIFRLVADGGVDANSSYLSFTYDVLGDNADEHYAAHGRGAERIVVRAAEMIDYTLGGSDVDAAPAAGDLGQGDEIHGESGDDSLYGLVGDDTLYGDSEDDDIIGGYGHDWMSGGTGQDGMIGGDGRVWTSKNTSDSSLSEALYGIAAVSTNELIATNGDMHLAVIHVDNALKKTVDLTPFSSDDFADPIAYVADSSTGDNDIIFGGLGSDWLHGGYGSDAISGAEAMPGDVSYTLDGVTYSYTLLPFSYDNPGNPGNILNWGGADGRPTEFSAYDENSPRPLIFVDPTNGYVFADPATNPNAVPFLLNFDALDGTGTDATDQVDGLASDGDDRIFGDLGHDWLVGGTGRDHVFGGFGDDMLDIDDDRSTNDGLNDEPDAFDSYADISFGGGGRDILLANTGGDRMIDWNGEFNSYLVPFSPFGAGTIVRAGNPSTVAFLYDLSEADGADPTRIADGGDVSRNGEPYGEIGLVKQQDPHAGDQRGGPADPQPGNSKGSKDTRAAGDTMLDDGTAGGGAPDAGNGNNGNGNGNNGNGGPTSTIEQVVEPSSTLSMLSEQSVESLIVSGLSPMGDSSQIGGFDLSQPLNPVTPAQDAANTPAPPNTNDVLVYDARVDGMLTPDEVLLLDAADAAAADAGTGKGNGKKNKAFKWAAQ
ncbi:calcium-binding protein [Sulfitobacter sp.]|uniref:calcium-binding protein n=1 Tax=Sulfitobacter sp. TaxID=1903071 RepID=UPI0030026941